MYKPLTLQATLICALVLSVSTARAQLPPPEIRFEPVMSGGQYWFHGIHQDHAGFLWLATEGGLVRYDGYTARPYRATPGDSTALPSNVIYAVSSNSNGEIWLAPGDEFGRLTPSSGIYETARLESVRDIVHDRQGRQWTAGLVGGRWALRTAAPGEAPQEVHPFPGDAALTTVDGRGLRIVADSDDRIWIAGDTLGVARAAPRPDGTIDLVHWGVADTVLGIGPGRGGQVWIISNEGLHRSREDDELELVIPRELLPEAARTARRILVDRRGLVWLAPSNAGGVIVLDPATGEHISLELRTGGASSVSDSRISTIYEDRSGVLWFGTTAGLYKLAPQWGAFHTYRMPESDLAPTVAAGSDGRIWAGSVCGPLYSFDPDTERFSLASDLLTGFEEPRCPMRILNDRSGNIWIGTFPLGDGEGGIFRYSHTARKTTAYRRDPDDDASFGSRRVRDILEDRHGRIWIGGEQGLHRYDPAIDGFVHYISDPQDTTTLQDDVVWSLYEDEQGAIWVGAGGLNRLDPETGRVTRFPPDPVDPNALPSAAVTWIHGSRREKGVLWVGTYDGGLARFDIATGAVTRYTERDGLPNNYVKAVLEDARGRLWVPTNKGLARINPATGSVQVFGVANGLRSDLFGLYDAVTLPDGRFVLANQDALVLFHPDSVDVVDESASIALSSFRVFDQEISVRAIPERPIRLRHNDNFFSFEFAALHFKAPERTRYSYRLEGLDRDWIESGPRRYAAYTNLPPGRYTFQVRADVGSGWDPNELSVPVVIVPAWWQTAWFRLLASLGLLAGLVVTVRYVSTRRLRQRLRALELERRLQAERERISLDLHDHVGAQLSTLVSGIDLVRLSEQTGGDSSASEGHLDRLEAYARRTMTQLRETIWALDHNTVTIEALHQRVCAHARELRMIRAGVPSITCTLDASAGDAARTLSSTQALNLYRIVQEATQNALKHAGATSLSIAVRVSANAVTVEVCDDGEFTVGQPVEDLQLSGYGLAGMQRRAAEIGGSFTMETDGGTTVRVTVSLSEPP